MCDFKIQTDILSINFRIYNEPLCLPGRVIARIQGGETCESALKILLTLPDKVLFPTPWVLGAPQGLYIPALSFHYRKGLHVTLLLPPPNKTMNS